MEILRQETDEDHPLTTAVLCHKLVSMGITCNPRTLGRDVKLLNEQGYEIMFHVRDQQRTLICLPDRLAFFHAHRGKNGENTVKTRKIRSWSGQTDCLMAGFFAFRGKNGRKTLVLIWSFFVQQRKFALTKQRDLNICLTKIHTDYEK